MFKQLVRSFFTPFKLEEEPPKKYTHIIVTYESDEKTFNDVRKSCENGELLGNMREWMQCQVDKVTVELADDLDTWDNKRTWCLRIYHPAH